MRSTVKVTQHRSVTFQPIAVVVVTGSLGRLVLTDVVLALKDSAELQCQKVSLRAHLTSEELLRVDLYGP